MMSFGFRSSFGLFMEPLNEVNGWGRDTISLALAIQNLAWGVISVLAGGLADRFGNLRVIVGGAALYAIGIWMTAGVAEVWVLNSGTGLLVGAGVAGTAFGVVLPAMARAVDESRRQWVLGLGTAAGSMGQFVLAPFIQYLIEWLGWVGALHAMGFMALSMALLAMPLAPYSGSGEKGIAEVPNAGAMSETVVLARGCRSYWLLVTGFFVCGFHVAFITVHMPAFLGDAGFEPQVGAWSIGLIGLFNVFGSLLSGYLSSRFPMKTVLVGLYGLRAVIIAMFMMLPLTLISVLVFSCMMGFLWLATVPPTTGLVAVMFGTRYMATLYGVVFLGHQLGSFSGVWLGGWIFELVGSYDLVWWAGVVLGLLAMLLHWPIREERVSCSNMEMKPKLEV